MAEIRIDFKSSGAKRTLEQLDQVGRKARGSIDPVKSLADELERLFTAEARAKGGGTSKGIADLGKNSTRASQQAAKLADTVAKIFERPNAATVRRSPVRQVGDDAEQSARQVNVLQSALNGIGIRLGALAVDVPLRAISSAIGGVAGLIGSAVDEFADFDKALFDFAQKAGVPRDSLKGLSDQAKELAAVTSQTPTGVAQTADALLALGQTAEEVEDRLQGIVFTADVLGEDPVLTGKVIGAGLKAFEQFGETSESLGDKLLTLKDTTAALSDGGLGEIEQLFSKAAPVAAELGVGLDELAAAFGVLRNAAVPAEVAATGLRTVFERLAAPTGAAQQELNRLRVEAFDAQGEFVGLEAVLRQFLESTQELTQQERLAKLQTIFGSQGLTPVLALLKDLDDGFAATVDNLEGSSGRVVNALEVINQSLSRQRELFGGAISSALTDLGEAIAPISGAFVALSSNILKAATEGTTAFDTLGRAGRDFAQALADNPQIAEQLGQALARLGETVADLVASGLDRLAAFLDANANAAGDLAKSVTDTLIDALQAAGAAVAVLFSALQLLAPVLAFVAGNSELASVALATFAGTVASIKIAALVKSVIALVAAFKGLAVVVGGFLAGGGLAAVGTAAVVLAPLLLGVAAAAAVVAAGLSALNVINLRRNQRQIEALREGVEAAADAGFALANQLRNAREATDELTESGRRLTEADRERNAELIENAQERLKSLQAERDALDEVELKGRGGVLKRQEQALANEKQQLDTTIAALERQVELFEESSEAAEAAAEATQQQADAAVGVPPNLEAQIDLSLDALQKGFAEQQALIARERAQSAAEIAESGKTPEEAQDAILEAEKGFLEERLQLQRDFVANLEAAIAAGDSSEETAAALVAAETQLFQLRTNAAEEAAKATETAEKNRIDSLRSAQEEAKRILEESENDRQKGILELEQSLRASGQDEISIREAVASESLRIERESLDQQIELIEERAELAGEGTDEERDALIELAGLRNDLIQNQINAEKAARDAQINAITRTARLASIAASEEIDAAAQRLAAQERVAASFERQNTLIQAQTNLQQAVGALQLAVADRQQSRLQQALAARRRTAEIEKQLADGANLSAEERLALTQERSRLEKQIAQTGVGRGANEQRILQQIIRDQRARFEQERSALERRQESERLSLELEIQRNRIAADRSVREEEIALRRLELQRQELETEVQLARLRGDDIAAAGAEASLRLLDEQLEGQQEIIELAREAAGIEEQAAEFQRQALEATQQAEALDLASQQQQTAAQLAEDAQEAGGRTLRDAERLVTETDRRATEEERISDTLATSLDRTDSLLESQRSLLETTIRLADEQERFASAMNAGARGGSLPSFRAGGVAPGGAVQVHKDEVITLPRGAVVSSQSVSRSEQRRLARAAFAAQVLPGALKPLGSIPMGAAAEVGGADGRMIKALLKEVQSLNKAMRASGGGAVSPTVVQNFPRNDAPSRRDAAGDAWYWASRF